MIRILTGRVLAVPGQLRVPGRRVAPRDTSLTPHAVTPERRGPRGRGARSTNLVLDQRHQSNKDHRSLYFCWGEVNFIAIFDQSRRSALGSGSWHTAHSTGWPLGLAVARAHSPQTNHDLRLRLGGDRHERTSIQHKQESQRRYRGFISMQVGLGRGDRVLRFLFGVAHGLPWISTLHGTYMVDTRPHSTLQRPEDRHVLFPKRSDELLGRPRVPDYSCTCGL